MNYDLTRSVLEALEREGVSKFRDISEMEGNTWRQPGTEELFRAIRSTWDFARRTTRPIFPAGVYKHRSIEEAKALKERWGQANFDAHQARARNGARSES